MPSDLLPVEEALARVLDGVAPLAAEHVMLAAALDRVLAAPLAALRTQPPRDVSAMDGYALRAADAMALPAAFRVIGTAPAGHPFAGRVGVGEAVRIFTGAVVPEGADAILLQEDAERAADGGILAKETPRQGQHIRLRGLDFMEGEVLLHAGQRLGMRELALAAALNHAAVPVRRRPLVAILATGDELVQPGGRVAEGQIVASNSFAIAGLVQSIGGTALDLGIVPDDAGAIGAAIEGGSAADILVTLGGASVGDHDLVRDVLAAHGLDHGFWRIAMRPGKPLIFGRLGEKRVLGLPGNPVSAVVCALLFLQPLLERLLGLPDRPMEITARLGAPVKANDRRQDYLRARLSFAEDGTRIATPFDRQDSAMLSTLVQADCLIVRPPYAAAAQAGAGCRIMMMP